MIGLPFGEFLREIPAQGKLDIRIGEEVLPVRIAGAKYVATYPPPDPEKIKELKEIIP
jgi:hypothetical protein